MSTWDEHAPITGKPPDSVIYHAEADKPVRCTALRAGARAPCGRVLLGWDGVLHHALLQCTCGAAFYVRREFPAWYIRPVPVGALQAGAEPDFLADLMAHVPQVVLVNVPEGPKASQIADGRRRDWQRGAPPRCPACQKAVSNWSRMLQDALYECTNSACRSRFYIARSFTTAGPNAEDVSVFVLEEITSAEWRRLIAFDARVDEELVALGLVRAQ